MFGLRIFVRVQTFRRRPFVPSHNFFLPEFITNIDTVNFKIIDIITTYIININISNTIIILQTIILKHNIKFANITKGSHPERKVHFFLTLFKRPLAPPPLSFEHHVGNFF